MSLRTLRYVGGDVTDHSIVLQRVRRAIRALQKGVVDLGPDRAQLCTYFEDIQTHDRRKMLVLSPLAASALPPYADGPVSIHCQSDDTPFRLVCRSIERISDTKARVDLTGACIVEEASNEQRHVVTTRHPLALAVLGGVADSEGHVFPVAEISAGSCVIDATAPLTPGDDLGAVEVVGDRNVLRRGAAVVVAATPWCTPDGSRRFRCMLHLRDADPNTSEPVADIISNPTRIKRILTLAAMGATRGTYQALAWGHGTIRLRDTDSDSVTLVLDTLPQSRMHPAFIKVEFDLFSVSYEVSLRILERSGNDLRTAMPLHVRRWRVLHRDHEVARQEAHGLRMSFRNPVSGERELREITELSFQRVSFDASSTKQLLWQGLPLEEATLISAGRKVRLGEVRIDSLETTNGKTIARAIVRRSDASQDPDFVTMVETIGHPEVHVHDGDNFLAMLSIYKQAGLFAPHMRRNLDPIMPAAKHVWHSMHRMGPDMVQTLVHGPEDNPDGAVTAVRPWERAFIAQHFVSVNATSTTAAGRLQLAYVDHVQSRPDGHYLVFFVKADNSQMNAFYQRFFAATGTPETIERRNVALWCKPGDSLISVPSNDNTNFSIRGIRANEEPTISRAAERALGEQGAAALSFLPGELRIPETSSRFARVGLERRRVCETVIGQGLPLYALVEEITSPGFNFTWMLNATWIVPVHAERDGRRDGLRAAMQHIMKKPTQTPTGDIFVNTVEGVDEAPLIEAGFEKLADVYAYTMNRAGLYRYFHYSSDRYGEVDVRTQQREARRTLQRDSLPPDSRKVI